jgi:iron complex transport system ATP-binding protein
VNAIEASEVSVALGAAVVVRGLSLSVDAGEWVALIGPNGAGKTTVLRTLAGLIPFGGSIVLAGRSVASSTRREIARRVALVSQTPEMPRQLTVAEYVLLGRTPYIGLLGGESDADRLCAERALARLSLRSFAGRPLRSLSGGERQRVALARALAQEPSVLLLDEPTSALDLGRQQQALELVDSVRREEGVTVVSAMHDLSLAGQYADRLLLLDRGEVVACGPPREVLCERTIASRYGASVRVVHDRGEVFVLPRRGGGTVDVRDTCDMGVRARRGVDL